jgi:hypothetical protein
VKKPKLTLQEHREFGAALKAFRNRLLIKYEVRILNAEPKNSPPVKAVQKALKAVDELRSAMDEVLFQDYFDETGDEYKKIYYGTDEAK